MKCAVYMRLCIYEHRRKSCGLGVGGRDPQIVEWGIVGGGREVSMRYYYILQCTGI